MARQVSGSQSAGRPDTDEDRVRQSDSRNSNSSKVRQQAARRFAATLPGADFDVEAQHEAQEKMAEASVARLRLSSLNRKLQFVVDHESADVTVRVIDSETDRVIKVLPPEELRRINRGPESGKGILLDRQV
jgi:flagellar protein FlaG